MKRISSLFKVDINEENSESVLLIEPEPFNSSNKSLYKFYINSSLKILGCVTLVMLIILFIYIIMLTKSIYTSVNVMTDEITKNVIPYISNITEDLNVISYYIEKLAQNFAEDGPIVYKILEPLLKYIKEIAAEIKKIIGN